MKTVFAVVFIIGLAVLAIGQYAPKDTTQTLPSLSGFTLDEVVSFRVLSQAQVMLQGKREGSKWLQSNADTPIQLQPLVVEQLLHDLQTMQVKRIASTKPEYHTRFMVNDMEVVLEDAKGKALLDVFVGKPATDLRSTYIRLANQDTVLTVDKILTWQVKRTPDSWVKKENITKDQSPEPVTP